MNRVTRGVFGVIAVLAAGCAQPPNVFSTSVKGQSTIPGVPIPLPFSGAIPQVAGLGSLDFNQNQEFKNQGVTKDQVDSVEVMGITLRILSPTAQDYSFIDSVKLSAKADGAPQVLVAEKANVQSLHLAAPNPTLTLDLRNPEIKPFVTAPSMSVMVEGTGRAPPTDTVIEATMDLKVAAHVL